MPVAKNQVRLGRIAGAKPTSIDALFCAAKGRWRMIGRLAFFVLNAVIIAMSIVRTGYGQHSSKAPPIPESEAKTMIALVKSNWRSQNGESAEQIIAKVSTVAKFVPRGWDVAQTEDGSTRSVVFSWAKRRGDGEGEEYTIGWEIKPDGTAALNTPYALPMELGWRAFALSLIQAEVDNGTPGPNRRFLHDLSNLNFVETAHGKLGDLLKMGQCKLRDPVGVDYEPKLSPDKDGDFFQLQLSVDCDIPGPSYFTRDGIIIFKKRGTQRWQPLSFFAYRISKYPPSTWFDRAEPKEQELFDAVKRAFERAGFE